MSIDDVRSPITRSLDHPIVRPPPAQVSRAQTESLDLACRRLRQLGQKLDPPRTLVLGEPLADELLQFRRQLGRDGDALPRARRRRSASRGRRRSSRPTTPHSSTDGCATSAFSTSTGLTHSPPTLSMSSERPACQKKPSASCVYAVAGAEPVAFDGVLRSSRADSSSRRTPSRRGSTDCRSRLPARLTTSSSRMRAS